LSPDLVPEGFWFGRDYFKSNLKTAKKWKRPGLAFVELTNPHTLFFKEVGTLLKLAQLKIFIISDTASRMS